MKLKIIIAITLGGLNGYIWRTLYANGVQVGRAQAFYAARKAADERYRRWFVIDRNTCEIRLKAEGKSTQGG